MPHLRIILSDCRVDVVIISSLQLFEIVRHSPIDLGDHLREFGCGKGPSLGVDGSELTAIDRHQLTAEQIELCAQQPQGATDFAKRGEVLTPNVGARL
jgi:hypothetical protein